MKNLLRLKKIFLGTFVLTALGTANDLRADIWNDFSNTVDSIFSTNVRPRNFLWRNNFAVDIRETEREYFVDAELPGIKREEIDLTIQNQGLVIAVTTKKQDDQENGGYVRRECRNSASTRYIQLSNANFDKIHAKLEDGILHIRVEKTEEKQDVRKVKIN